MYCKFMLRRLQYIWYVSTAVFQARGEEVASIEDRNQLLDAALAAAKHDKATMTTMRFYHDDLAIMDAIVARFGLRSRSAAVRMSIRYLAGFTEVAP